MVAGQLLGGPHLVVVASVFSPDSRLLAYISSVKSGQLSLTIANADGSGRWDIPDPDGHLPGAWLGATLTR